MQAHFPESGLGAELTSCVPLISEQGHTPRALGPPDSVADANDEVTGLLSLPVHTREGDAFPTGLLTRE